MPSWIDWGISIIVWLQGLGEWLLAPMKGFSFLGEELFALLIMPLVMWCLDANLGIRLGLILVTSNTLNEILKIVFGLPRPYWITDRVGAFDSETSFGLPSGHSQNAVAFWGRLAAAWRMRRGLAISRAATGPMSISSTGTSSTISCSTCSPATPARPSSGGTGPTAASLMSLVGLSNTRL